MSLIGTLGKALKINPAGLPVGHVPRLSRVRMTRRRFGSNAEEIVTPSIEPGTRFLFDLSAAAEVDVAISRLPSGVHYVETCSANAARPGCRRTVPVDRFTRLTEPAGQDCIPFNGWVGRHALALGRYFVVLRARNTGGSSRPVSVEFEVTH